MKVLIGALVDVLPLILCEEITLLQTKNLQFFSF